MKSNKKNVYRDLGAGKITAPNKVKNLPKCEKTVGKGDLRAGRK